MKFNPEHYKYFIHQSRDHNSVQVTAVSTYAGHTVKGYAKCDPRDNYNKKLGMELAAARCNLKVAEKRKARAKQKFHEANEHLNQAIAYASRMNDYFDDATRAVGEAETAINELLKDM